MRFATAVALSLLISACSNSAEEELKNQYVANYIESTTPIFLEQLKERARELNISREQLASLTETANDRIEKMAQCSYTAYQHYPKRYHDAMIDAVVHGNDVQASREKVSLMIEQDMQKGLILQDKIIESARKVRNKLNDCMAS